MCKACRWQANKVAWRQPQSLQQRSRQRRECQLLHCQSKTACHTRSPSLPKHRSGSTWLTALCATTSAHAAPGSPEAAAASVAPRMSCHASEARYHSSLPRRAAPYALFVSYSVGYMAPLTEARHPSGPCHGHRDTQLQLLTWGR